MVYWVQQILETLIHLILQCQKKSHFITSPLISLEKLSIGKLSKILISLESSDFIIGSKYLQLFSLKWQACCVHFQESICQILGPNNHSPSAGGFFKWAWWSVEKAVHSSHNWNSWTSTFPWDSRHSSICSRSGQAVRSAPPSPSVHLTFDMHYEISSYT